MTESTKLTLEILNFFALEKKEPNLAFLNELIDKHQRKVKWETLTKIIDWERGELTGNYLPAVELYFHRVIHQGMGGTCWTHSVGFHWLLKNLGFHVSYVYMNPGHICLRVDLDQAYYVDVGYCAPLFQAYPMFESFKVNDAREHFDYTVDGEMITVTREPGPVKTLDPTPAKLEDMVRHIKRSNDWNTSPVLGEIQIFGYIDGAATSLKNNLLKQHLASGKKELYLSKDEMEHWVTDKFGVEKSLYVDALTFYEKKKDPIF